MDPLSYLALGFAPGFFWLWIVVLGNRQRPDPRALVIRTFLLGVGVALPIVFVEYLIGSTTGIGTGDLGEIIFTSFVVAGFVEEFGKFLVVRLSLGGSPYLDEPLRGLVYAAAVALGFASIENVFYMVRFGPEVLGVRALTSTVGHIAFSALWGYGLGADRLACAEGRPSRGFAILGLIGAIVVHGTYDVATFLDRGDFLGVVLLGSVAICVGLFIRANRRSIHQGRRGFRKIRCSDCDALCPYGKGYCSGCGASLSRHAPIHCGVCRKIIELRAAYCIHCGAHQATD